MSVQPTIYYNNLSVHTSNDLKNIISSISHDFCIPSTENTSLPVFKTSIVTDINEPTFNTLLRYETILFQRKICPLKRRYSFRNMLQAQDSLEALNLFESLAYAPYALNARQLLRQYLYSKYNFSTYYHLAQYANVKKIDILPREISNIPTLRMITIPEGAHLPSPSKSIREYLYNYVSNWSKNPRLTNQQCNLFFCNINNDSSNRRKQRYLLPLYNIPEFLLAFSFIEGRDFSHTESQQNPDKLPTIKKDRGCSSFSYKSVLTQSSLLIPEPFVYTPYTIGTLYRCDNIFLFRKLNTLMYYYNLYLSDAILNAITQNCRLNYQETISLKDFIVRNIFEDKNFILTGLKSKYLDFMLPFDIFFQYYIYSSRQSSLEFLKQRIAGIKKDVLKILSVTAHTHESKDFLTFDNNENFSILTSEEKIYTQLKNNPFFSNYYLSYNSFSHNFITDELNESPINFDIIKEVLPIAMN